MTEQRLALVIAVDSYEDPGLQQLTAPGSDAAVLAEVLGDAELGGFAVEVLRNPASWAAAVGIDELLADRRTSDMVLLHFSGHGLKDDSGELYLATSNTKPDRLPSTALRAAWVNELMRRSRARRIVLLLDCCHGGAFERGVVPRTGGRVDVGEQFDPGNLGEGRGLAVLTASTAMEFAFEGPQLAGGAAGPSVFTGAVVEGIRTGEADRDQDGRVSLGELYDYVYESVRAKSPHQTPGKWEFGVQGGLYLARNPRRRVIPSRIPPELREALASQTAFVRLGAVHELAHLAAGSDLALAAAARLALAPLVEDDSRRVAATAGDALAETAVRFADPVIDFGRVEIGAAPLVAEVAIEGPPLALASVVNTTGPGVRAGIEGRALRVRWTPAGPGALDEVITATGPAGEARLRVTGEVVGAADALTEEPVALNVLPDPDWPCANPLGTSGPADLESVALEGSTLAAIRLASGDEASTVEVWDMDRRQLRHQFRHDPPLKSVAMDREAVWLVGRTADDRALVLWELAGGQRRHTLLQPYPVGGFVLVPNREQIIVGGENHTTLSVWDMGTGELRDSLTHEGPIEDWKISPDGSWVGAIHIKRGVLGAKKDCLLRLWNLSAGPARHDIYLDRGVDWWTFSPDGQWLKAGGKDAQTKLWDVAHGQPADAVFRGPLLDPEFSEDGGMAATQRDYRDRGGIWLWDLRARRHLRTLDLAEHAFDVAFSPQGDLLATGTYGREGQIWDVSTGRALRSITGESTFAGLQFSPDGKYLAAPSYRRAAVFVWDVVNGRLRYEFTCGTSENSVFFEFSPDARRIAAHTYGDDQVRVWELATGTHRTFHVRGFVFSNFSRDGRWLITRSRDKAMVWEL